MPSFAKWGESGCVELTLVAIAPIYFASFIRPGEKITCCESMGGTSTCWTRSTAPG
jgi:hypothetical protein